MTADRLPPAPARPAGRLAVAAVLLAVAVVALGVLLLQDGLVRLGALDGPSWVAGVIEGDGIAISPTWVVGAVGAVVALAGLATLAAALLPRRREGSPLRSDGLYVLDGDVARLASAAARTVPGVLHTTSVRRRRTLAVSVLTDGTPGVRAAVRDAVGSRVAALSRPPRLTVRVHEPPGAGSHTAPAARPATGTEATP